MSRTKPKPISISTDVSSVDIEIDCFIYKAGEKGEY